MAPESTKFPDASTAMQCPLVSVPETVANSVVLPETVALVGGEPPRIGVLLVRAPDEDSAEVDEK